MALKYPTFSGLNALTDLTVSGTTTTLATTNTIISDKLIELANGTDGTPSGDAGIIVERGSSTNAAIIWDESRDEFVLGTTSATGASTGDLTVTPGNVSVERIGCGTEQAEAEVHAKRDTASGVQYSTTATIISEDDSRPSIQLAGGANNIGLIQFGDNAAVAAGQIYYDHSTDKLRIDCGAVGDVLNIADTGALFATGSAPYFSLKNSTAENTEGGCESRLIFQDHDTTSLASIEGSHKGTANDTKGKLIFATHTGSGLEVALTISEAQTATFESSVSLKERSAASADVAAYGQLWVKDNAPNDLYFTNDNGDDVQITNNTGLNAAAPAANDANTILHVQVFS